MFSWLYLTTGLQNSPQLNILLLQIKTFEIATVLNQVWCPVHLHRPCEVGPAYAPAHPVVFLPTTL